MTDWSRVDESVGYYPSIWGRFKANVKVWQDYNEEPVIMTIDDIVVECDSHGEYDDIGDIYDEIRDKLKRGNIDFDDFDVEESEIDFVEFI